ncbi:MAG: hypothetical protein V4660_09350 [Pseudomonadota bacterium]
MEDFDIDGFGQPLKFSWVAPSGEFIEGNPKSKKIPDIALWGGMNLIISEKAKQILNDVLKDNGEYYPLVGPCKNYWFYNPIKRLGNEVINLEKTKSLYFDDGSWDKLENLVFKSDAEKIVPALFTLEIDRGVRLYCNSDFKEKVEKQGITGIWFSAEN